VLSSFIETRFSFLPRVLPVSAEEFFMAEALELDTLLTFEYILFALKTDFWALLFGFYYKLFKFVFCFF
jgi:hypothetical protein